MRKLMNLNVTDYIIVSIVPPQDRAEVLEKFRDYISAETRSKEVIIGQQEGDQITTWDIDGEEYTIGIRKVQ